VTYLASGDERDRLTGGLRVVGGETRMSAGRGGADGAAVAQLEGDAKAGEDQRGGVGDCASSAAMAGRWPGWSKVYGPGHRHLAALDEAAAYMRDRVGTCADRADQSCGTCQRRLRAARDYNRLVAQMLQAAEAARTADAGQPKPYSPRALPTGHHPAPGREAGQ
jgi:hypothetical protein